MPSTSPSRAELERLMEAARDARSAALHTRVVDLRTAVLRLLRSPAAAKPVQTA